ncbi:SH3 domain-containing protein [Turneriella parva]|uniref:Uncharacterized protein n=1 Tax=Turneriella parva (strain ATCC BAA-1111 / DSM 21527 / NCTC 11395 / H) TaxID=869212 RepID=I4B9S7_TURPD|nr:SH3 domain-containing protein [Turneriella parva]AFM14034.1 hypothetical protein Turpa_3396 [Turneriella parva DSM 21527]
MKKLPILFLIFLSIDCSEPQAKNSAVIPEKEFRDIITQSQFYSGAGAGFFRFELKFTKDMKYSLAFAGGHTGWESAGTYAIKSNTAILNVQSCSGDLISADVCQKALQGTVCQVVETRESLDYSHDLSCKFANKFPAFGKDEVGDFDFPISKRILPAGAERKWQNIEVVTMGHTVWVSTTTVNLREKPSSQAPTREYIVDPYGERLPSLPKGTKVIVHARTKAKERIGTKENYWYLISVDATDYVWAFGEYFVR